MSWKKKSKKREIVYMECEVEWNKLLDICRLQENRPVFFMFCLCRAGVVRNIFFQYLEVEEVCYYLN